MSAHLKTVNRSTGKTMELTSTEIVDLVNSGLMTVNEARALLGLKRLKTNVIMRRENAVPFASGEEVLVQFDNFGRPLPTL